MSTSRARPDHRSSFAHVRESRVTSPSEAGADLRLETRGPFHLEATVRVLQRRPTNLVEVWRAGCYRRVRRTPEGLALVEVENRGTLETPDVRLRIAAGTVNEAARTGLIRSARRVLGLDIDPGPLHRLTDAEARLRPTARALRGMRPPRFDDLFEAFANVVPFQQVSLDAGVAIVSRLVQRFGERIEQDGRRCWAFPTARAIADSSFEAVRRCGLSRQKADALRALAKAVDTGVVSEAQLSRLSTADAMGSLLELPGIGPWSAALVLLRGLGRLDVFPPGDVGAMRGLAGLVRLREGASLRRIQERFGVSRGYLYFCSLGASLLARGLIHHAP